MNPPGDVRAAAERPESVGAPTCLVDHGWGDGRLTR